MTVKKQNVRFGNVIITTLDNGKDKIKTSHPFVVDIPNELVKNIITGMNHTRFEKAVHHLEYITLFQDSQDGRMYKKRG